jgi:ferredoxin-NADP reductase
MASRELRVATTARGMTAPEHFDLVVTATSAETPQIRAIHLTRPHGEPLPSWDAGAHVKVRLPDGDERHYSLVNGSTDPAATTRPHAYLLGVRLEEASRGGSRFMHALQAGDTVRVSAPSNNFPLEPSTKPIMLVAGGIGITPLLSMAARLTANGDRFRMIYAGRSKGHLAFVKEVEALASARLTLHTDDRSGLLDVNGLMESLQDGEPLYLCGPLPMIDAAIAAAKRLGWPKGRLHFEIFAASAPAAGDQPFEVVLANSGKSYNVPADKTILDVLIEAGEDPLHDCKRGECGICQVGVIEGTPDHRDYILSDAEKASGKMMQICISRSKTPRLVLDL